MLRLASFVGLAALAFVATAGLVRPLVPLPEEHDLRRRFDVVRSASPGPTLIFVGPSTTRCAFDPQIVDAELGRLGHPVRSFNLGVPGATLFEIDHLIALLAGLELDGLRYLVIELHPPPPRLIRFRNLFTTRTVYWHTPRQTFDVLRAMVLARHRQALEPQRALHHLRHGLWRFTSVGQADRILDRLRDPTPEPDARAGFSSQDCTSPENMREARERYLRNQPELRRRAEWIDAQNRVPVPLEHLDPPKLRRQVERLRALGVEPVYVLTPFLRPVPGIHGLRREGVLPTLLPFNSPQRDAILFEPRHRWDELHLNAEGAALFSREFARRFARWLETGSET